MPATNIKRHIPLPLETPAWFCGNCGAVSLDAKNICNPAGRLKKGDWCGSRDLPPPRFCRNRVNNDRYSCRKCGKAAINKALLCEPEKMALPEEHGG
ncbi:MAG: hypothetical protein RBR09_12305 [Desulfobulbaceae bacterium]|jgi:ribosomal protein S27AE|nr:hypothetical protein [Desulfobulbaceae bacterium]MDY0352031.1 hypothetical protein [Desulfobulbaceae bacterium]